MLNKTSKYMLAKFQVHEKWESEGKRKLKTACQSLNIKFAHLAPTLVVMATHAHTPHILGARGLWVSS